MASQKKNIDSDFMEEIEQNVITSFRSVMKRITTIWNELGIAEEFQYDRAKSAQKYVLTNMQEMVESEECLYKNIVERIDKYSKEISELSKILDIPHAEVDESMALLEKEKYLRTQLDELTQEQHSRMKVLQELRKVEQKFCTILSLPPHEISSRTGVPSKNDLRELEDHVKMLKEERERRHKKFCLAKRELTTIMETTELTPETLFEREVICYDDDQFLLSDENLKELEDFVVKVQNKRTKLEREKKDLLEKLTMLWDRLSVGICERKKFLANHQDCRLSTMMSIQQEIDRCQEIKKQNMKSYIKSLQEELHRMWEKCHISEHEQNEFYSLCDDDFSEETLNRYEDEVLKMKKRYDETKLILEKIEKRQQLWNLMIAFENKARDPNRFTNRGGNLLQEERERKKLQKDLPKLESDLFKLIEEYEESSGKLFLFNGMNFQEYVRDQWEQRINEKENEKVQRQKQRNLMVEHEVTMGTPVGKRLLSIAPKSAPSKMFRSNASVFRTPGLSSRLKTPESLCSSRSKRFRGVRGTPARGSPLMAVTRKSIRHGLSEQNKAKKTASPNATSYSDFATEVNRPSRSGLRSSALVQKKVLGSKTAQNRSRRSAGKTPNKSLRSSAAKITPVRGKLGLPFLI